MDHLRRAARDTWADLTLVRVAEQTVGSDGVSARWPGRLGDRADGLFVYGSKEPVRCHNH